MNNQEAPINQQFNSTPPQSCPKCGTSIEGNETFCPQCGTPINSQEVKENNKKKKILITVVISIVVVAVVALAIFGILCSVAKSNVVGTWISDPIYLKKYGGLVTRITIISEDGTYTTAGARNSDKKIVFTKKGTWYMEGTSAVLREEGSIGEGGAYYTYHLNDTLTNGELTYTRVED